MPIKVLHFPLCLLQCTPAEFVTISKSLVKLMKHFQSNKEVATSKLESPLLGNLFTEVRKMISYLIKREYFSDVGFNLFVVYWNPQVRQDTLLSPCLSPLRFINGYWQI